MGRQGLLSAVLASANRTIRLNHNHLHRATLGMLMTIGILRHVHILALLGEQAINLPTIWKGVRKTCLRYLAVAGYRALTSPPRSIGAL